MSHNTVYDGWESSRTGLTGRSYLYALAPIGVGTPAVESLTGYIARLAAAHAVETGVLVNHELLPRIPLTKGVRAGKTPMKRPKYSFFSASHTLNGVGNRPRLWVSLLEQLTRMQQLDLLTALPWSAALSCIHLLRKNRAWCSFCYGGECSPDPPVYDRLLWAFQIVTVCPSHGWPLDSNCPTCGRTQYVFSSKTRPGYCSRCQSWLGRKPEPGNHQDLTDQIHIAEMVGELLARSPFVPSGFSLDLFRENINRYARADGGNLRFRARIQDRHIQGWKQGKNTPILDSLVVLSRSLKVSVVRLLTERISIAHDPGHQRTAYAHYRVADNLVEDALRTALQAEIPPPPLDIAKQLGYRSVESLQARYKGLCREITDRRRSSLNISSPQACTVPVPRHLIDNALIAELSKVEFTSLRAVAKSVGLRNIRRLYKSFNDLTRAVIARNRRSASGRVDAIEKALRQAFDERPVPTVTEIARRLGFAGVSSVTSRFPELTAELRRRHQSRLRERTHRTSEPVRQRLTEALGEFPPPSFSAVIKRIGVHPTKVRTDFPDLWRALRSRYVMYKQDAISRKRQAFLNDIRRTVGELHCKGINPTPQLVFATLPEPQFRCRNAIAKAVRLARRELSIEPG
jgi:hypothetical protein